MTQNKKPFLRSAFELVAIVAVALGLALGIQAFLIKPYEIPSGSMEPTLAIGQRVLVDRIGTHFSSPKIGDIIVFHPPAVESCANSNEGVSASGQTFGRACDAVGEKASSQTYIKRVVGLPGDMIYIKNGHVYRNGVRESDSYIEPCDGASECNFRSPIKIPAGDYYMMGDNRPDSLDSRFWGPVPKGWIIGKAFFTYWPPDRIGLL